MEEVLEATRWLVGVNVRARIGYGSTGLNEHYWMECSTIGIS